MPANEHTGRDLGRGDPVTIVATYQTLPSGLTTCFQTEISLPARRLNITLNTMNHQQR